MKALVLCGDIWHSPQIAREGLQALSETEFAFDWVEDTRDWTPEVMLMYPFVILTKSDNVSQTDRTGWMTDTIQTAFSDYVNQGNGLLAVHSGTAEYEQKSVLRGLLGGVFLHHPEQCQVTIHPHSGHPLCSGSVPCTLVDEHYFMALDDPNADVFMTTTSINGEQPGAWRRNAGNGRVVVMTPGHHVDVWLHPAYQALLRNAMRWCSKL